MQKISSRSIAVAEKIRDREPFQTYGALFGTDESYHYQSGRLSGADYDRFIEDMPFIRYAVFSYSTPIAWWSAKRGWYKVSQKFSVTTSHHQGRLYLAHNPTVCATCGNSGTTWDFLANHTCSTWDFETDAALDDCLYWSRPEADCAGPRVGVRSSDGVVVCEHHINHVPA